MELYCDGAVSGNPGPGAIAFVGYSNSKKVVCHAEMLSLQVTNNIAEYKAVLGAMDYLHQQSGSHTIYTDSSLFVKQITGKDKVKNPELKRLHKLVEEKLLYGLTGIIKFEWIPRKKNKEADKIANYLLEEYLNK